MLVNATGPTHAAVVPMPGLLLKDPQGGVVASDALGGGTNSCPGRWGWSAPAAPGSGLPVMRAIGAAWSPPRASATAAANAAVGGCHIRHPHDRPRGGGARFRDLTCLGCTVVDAFAQEQMPGHPDQGGCTDVGRNHG